MPIHFGTDGWRAVISDTFTFSALRLVTQAIADAAASTQWENGFAQMDKSSKRRMVIGFDTRFLSDRYAKEAARVLGCKWIYGIISANQMHPLLPFHILFATCMLQVRS